MFERYTKSQLVDIATRCYVAYHKDSHMPYDRFKVDVTSHNDVRLVSPCSNKFDCDVLTFIVNFLNDCGVKYCVLSNGNLIAISLSYYK